METPVFEEFDPESDCDCPGCVSRRRTNPNSPPAPFGGRPVAHRALVVATATAAAFTAVHAGPALAAPQTPDRPGIPAGDEPDTPQGRKAPLHGPAGQPARPGGLAGPVRTPPTTRSDIIRRAKDWVLAQVPYSMSTYWYDGYRQDCSGFVSMAWNLSGNEWTGSLHQYGTRISRKELQPGDILLFHNPSDPEKGSHVVIFGGWTDYTHSYYIVYEQTRPTTRRQATPYAYWSNSDRYIPYRYKGLTTPAPGTAQQVANSGNGNSSVGSNSNSSLSVNGSESVNGSGSGGGGGYRPGSGVAMTTTQFPGRRAFGPGANNPYVTLLGKFLIERGGGRFYPAGPGPRWSNADGRATQAFQRAQGWSGPDADGLPGPRTWSLLVTGQGRNIAATGVAGPPASTPPASAPPASSAPAPPSASRVPPYPGRGVFRPGAQSPYVAQLGRQLVKKGFGKYYTTGPGPRWGEPDRRGVEAFQRAQGWRGGAADGYPGPETWRRLFS
ncbi:peptidoglycan-binding protein [Streptomyces sp. NPDC002623]